MTIEIDTQTPVVLIGLLAVSSVSLFLRSIVFFRRDRRGIRSTYPSAWSLAQCRAIERLRLVTGLTLLSLWGLFLFVAPTIATRWENYAVIAFLVLLLLISNAWLLLLLPRNWEGFGAMSRSFAIVITFLVIWWGMAFTATGWLLAKATTWPAPQLHTISGVYAAAPAVHERPAC
jgi:signal transduction histidine kinase